MNFTMTPAWTLPVKTAARVCTTPPETESVSTCSAIILPRERLRLLTTSVGVMKHTVEETALKNLKFVVGIPAGVNTVPLIHARKNFFENSVAHTTETK